MKTITQRAVEYTAMREDPFTWNEYKMMHLAFIAGASTHLKKAMEEQQ